MTLKTLYIIHSHRAMGTTAIIKDSQSSRAILNWLINTELQLAKVRKVMPIEEFREDLTILQRDLSSMIDRWDWRLK